MTCGGPLARRRLSPALRWLSNRTRRNAGQHCQTCHPSMRQPVGTGEVPNELQLQIIRNKLGLVLDFSLFSNRPMDATTRQSATDGSGWRRERGRPPLAEVFGSIATRPSGSLGKKLIAFLGPGYLVAVGYMDPGNWATSLAGGSKFGYALLTVALVSNLMAILLQALCARLGIGSGRDLAQACRDAFPRAVSWPLWILAEVAICATDLAEVIGTAIGLNLLFHIPLEIGVVLTALDVFLVLWMQNLGFRYLEVFVVTMLAVIAACFAIQIAMADPEWRSEEHTSELQSQ